jgi:hypothetical protein
LRVLNSWAYVDDQQHLHIDIPGILNMLGKPDTRANRDAVAAGAVEALKEIVPGVPLFVESEGEEEARA